MFKKDTRRGLALGAAFSLLASLFVSAPAAQANEGGVVVLPFAGTSYNMLITEGFTLKTRLGSGVDEGRVDKLRYIIEKPVGYVISISNTVSSTVPAPDARFFSGQSTFSALAASSTISSAITPIGASVDGVNLLMIQPFSASAEIDSASPVVSVKVTAFLDLTPDGILDGSEPFQTVTINFVKWSAMGATVTLTQPIEGDTTVTASAAVTGVNFEQLGNSFNIFFESTKDLRSGFNASSSSASLSPALAASGSLSHSEAISAAGATETVAQSISATLYYGWDSVDHVLATKELGVTNSSIDDVTISPVVGDNLSAPTSDASAKRPNTTVTLNAAPYTGSKTVSVAVPMTLNVTYTAGGQAALSNDKYITINGVSYTSSDALPTTSARAVGSGAQVLTVTTVGFAGGESIALKANALNETYTYTLDVTAPSYTLTTPAFAATKPGTALTIVGDVADDWEVASPRTNQRLVAFWVGDSKFSASASVSFPVVAGSANVVMTPSPAASTGSTTLRITLQSQDLDTLLWSNVDSNTVTVDVTDKADAFTSSKTASVSASISYAVASAKYSWSGTITGYSANVGASVVVSATGLFFKDTTNDKIAADTITLRSGAAGIFTFQAAGAKAGTYTVSMAIGSSVTTSQVIIDAAGADAGKTITFDTTSINAGSTKVITGTLVDANGNPVHTSGSATIAVTYVPTGNAGIPIGTMPAETDADGEFSFTVLTGASDMGTATVTAVYYKDGTATALKDVLTFTQAVTVGGSATPVSDQKLTVGSFKGFVAIYALNYTGQKLSAKVAGKWLVENNLSRFERVVRLTGAAIPIVVDLYIDGKFVRTENIVTK